MFLRVYLSKNHAPARPMKQSALTNANPVTARQTSKLAALARGLLSVVLLLMWVVPTLLLSGCDAKPAPSGQTDSAATTRPAGKTFTVACTTTMIADLARQIAGPDAKIICLMKAGEDPHVYDARPRDAQTIADADLVLANGLHLESTLMTIIEHNAPGKFTLLAEDPRIDPLRSESAQGAPDPHCWFSVPYFRVYAERARDAFIKADPAHEQGYRDRAAAYIAKLDELDAWVRSELATIPRDKRAVITSHDAFEYFGREYGVDMHAVIGISTEQAPKPEDVNRLIELVRDKGIKALFIETSVNNTLNEIIKKVAAQGKAKIGGSLYSDSLGEPGTPTGDYIGVMKHNVSMMVQAMR
jgi:manganese/zinc/iron transport system substrate-binding protein